MSAREKRIVTEWVDEDDAPTLTGKELDHPQGRWQRGGETLEPEQGKAAFRTALKKKQVNMLIDADVLEYYRHKAGGRGYQTLINRTLRESMEHDGLLDAMRQMLREELHRSS
ncbi:MAG: BrnA antitoxin family protein [Acidithiobacillus ferriphilus]